MVEDWQRNRNREICSFSPGNYISSELIIQSVSRKKHKETSVFLRGATCTQFLAHYT